MKLKYNFNKIITVFLTAIIFFSFSFTVANAGPEEDLEEIQRQLEEIAKQKQNLNNDINNENALQSEYSKELSTIKNDISLLEIEIAETELTIEQLQLQIQLLEEEIAENEQAIIDAELEIERYEDETDQRMVEMYIDEKTSSQKDMIFQAEATSLIKLELYQTTIQEETNDLLEQLAQKRAELQEREEKLVQDKVDVQRDEVQLQEEKKSLEKDKVSLDAQKQIYARKINESIAREVSHEEILNNLSEEEQWALAEQTRLVQIIFDNIGDISDGQYVTAGTAIGQQGCTGLCTGPHLHFGLSYNGASVNPCSHLPSGVLSGCAGSSSSSLTWPIGGGINLTSGYGWRWGSFHYGIDVQNYSIPNTPIYAAHNGYISYGNDNACSWYTGNLPCNGAGANYAIICENANCSSGYKSMYLHLK
ncbi:peptidoglycan DD-metalloendopeptidase family protein [Candidatus Dojkabacteria bacterium]|uniref:Peptidoglycan DD-metalloendopeptidase family protein n=1 Tax=Candidatus Dojkabacteria bacterium TaxID=2099670 RepID=A0A955L5N0_9BACT|nr:peptidoglycan DD-metalloendopeptidase family protein [Candidatus Dojkabacteria bacterium]